MPWWRSASLPALALAAAAVLALAVGLRQFDVMSPGPANLAPGSAAKRGGQAPPQHRVPSEATPARVARQARPTVGEPPREPPAELASAPDLFMDLPILRHMEKLEHFDAIRTTTLDEELLLPLVATPAGAQGWRAWDQLSPEEQRRAWDNYQRYQQLPEQRQRMIERRYQQFQTLPPQEQQRLRQNYEAYRGLDPGARREFTEKYRRWKSDRH